MSRQNLTFFIEKTKFTITWRMSIASACYACNICHFLEIKTDDLKESGV